MLRNHILLCLTAATLASAQDEFSASTTLDHSEDANSVPTGRGGFAGLGDSVFFGGRIDSTAQGPDTPGQSDEVNSDSDDSSEDEQNWAGDNRKWWRKFRGRGWRETYTAEEKVKLIMEGITDDIESKPIDYNIEPFFERRMNQVTCNSNDALGQEKLIHQQGVVAPIRYVSTGGHDYTGMFEEGAPYGIMRFSDSGFIVEGTESSNPSVALKLFRDYAESTNLLYQIDFNNQDTLDFFPTDVDGNRKPFTTHPDVPTLEKNPCEMQTMTRKLIEASNLPFATGTGHFASVTYNNSFTANPIPNFPFELQLRVNEDAIGPYTGGDPLNYLLTIEPSDETPLFFAMARENPYDDELTQVGEVYMTDYLTRSRFADEVLHFQHENFRRDLAKLRNTERRMEMKEWENFENLRQSNGAGKLRDEFEMWGETPVPPMDNFEMELQEVVEGGIDGTLVTGMNCPFAWVLQQQMQ